MVESISRKYRTVTLNNAVDQSGVDPLYTGSITPLLKKQYSLFLWDARNGKVAAEGKGLNPVNVSAPAEFFFSVAPKTFEMTDPFATQITPTQSSGKFVESHGSILKNIRIGGTTGARPDRKPGNFSDVPLIGSAIDQMIQEVDVLTKHPLSSGAGALKTSLLSKGKKEGGRFSPSEEMNGFEQIVFLRNIFRHYSDKKEGKNPSNNLVMIWYNGKDGDSWLVEPKSFKVFRDAQSPLTYKYNIELTTLAPFSVAFAQEEDNQKEIFDPNTLFQRVQEYNTSLKRTFLLVSTQIRRLEGLGVFAENAILNPIINVIRGLGVIRATSTSFGSRLRSNAKILLSNLDEAVDLLAGAEGVEEQDALVRSLRRSQVTAARILSEPAAKETIETESTDRQSRYSSAYIQGGDSVTRSRVSPNVGSSAAFIGNNQPTGKVSQSYVQVGEDIRAVAGRLLGNRSAWHILVSINGLTAPYISTSGKRGTLSYGDPILYPSSEDGAADSSIDPNDSTAETDKGFQPEGLFRQAYGRDIRLKSVSAGTSGVDLADIKVNQRGDMSSIVGVDNVEQGVVIKFSTERGELPAHPTFGITFPLGKKATPNAVNTFRIRAEATLLSDPRISEIKSLDFLLEGDTLFVRADVVLLNQSDGLAAAVALRGR